MKTKHIASLDLKAIAQDGSFVGLLSPYGTVDQGGDLVEPGAYRKTIADQGTSRPLLWQHQSDQPIGMLELDDREDGLYAKGQILLDVPMGKSAYSLIKAGVVRGLSVGYRTIREDLQKGIRHLKEIKLYEGSIVTFPMAPEAQITSIKSTDPDAFRDAVRAALLPFKNDIMTAFTTKGRK